MTTSESFIINCHLLDFKKPQYIFKIGILLSQYSETIHLKKGPQEKYYLIYL